MRTWIIATALALAGCQDLATNEGALEQQQICNDLVGEKQELCGRICGEDHRDCLAACPNASCRDGCNVTVDRCANECANEALDDSEDCNPFTEDKI